MLEHKKRTLRPHQVKAIVNVLHKVKVMVIDVLMMSQVESEMAPHLKVNYILKLLTVRSFMLLGKSAHFAHFFAPRSCTNSLIEQIMIPNISELWEKH